MKLYKAALAAVGLLASGLVAAQPAEAAHQQVAAATCSFKVPAKLAMRAANTTYPVQLGSDCPTTMVGGAWTATWTNGFVESVLCQQGRCPGVALSTKYVPVGKVTWVGDAEGCVVEN